MISTIVIDQQPPHADIMSALSWLAERVKGDWYRTPEHSSQWTATDYLVICDSSDYQSPISHSHMREREIKAHWILHKKDRPSGCSTGKILSTNSIITLT